MKKSLTIKKLHKKLKNTKKKLKNTKFWKKETEKELKEYIELLHDELKNAYEKIDNLEEKQNCAPEIDGTKFVLEAIFRRIYNHIFTKCGFTDKGTFDNVAAVLDPIDISDIPHNEIIAHINTVDEFGIYRENKNCEGIITGIISKNNIPVYILHIKINNSIYKYTITVQNPNKYRQDGTRPKWSEEASKGNRIMLILNKNGIVAALKSRPTDHILDAKLLIFNR